MGSKRKSAGMIYQTIANLNPKNKVLVDLFCGGLGISEVFAKNGWQVKANDKNKHVVALAKQAIQGLDESKCLEFVYRAKFFDVIQNPSKYPDWYVGFVQCIWSFGNSQKTYMFGKTTEPYKKAGHELVVNKNPTLIKQIIPNLPQKYIDGIVKQKDWHTARLALKKVVSKLFLSKEKAQVEPLQHLQNTESLQRLEQLEQLELTSLDYQDVVIPAGAVIYCDPPYKGTAEYKEDGFDHNKFWAWVRDKAQTHKIYISEYQAPDDFKKVLEFAQNSTLGGVKQEPTKRVFVHN